MMDGVSVLGGTKGWVLAPKGGKGSAQPDLSEFFATGCGYSKVR